MLHIAWLQKCCGNVTRIKIHSIGNCCCELGVSVVIVIFAALVVVGVIVVVGVFVVIASLVVVLAVLICAVVVNAARTPPDSV